MTYERAIEILNPEHREHYESIEPVNEACRMGMDALEKQISKKPLKLADTALSEYLSICPNCKEDCILVGDHFCANCGQALDWSEE